MAEETNEFVYHNGVYLHVSQMILMAKNAGDYSLALPFLVSLLYHANRYHLQDINDEVDNIRKHYNLAPYPTAGTPASSNHMPNFETSQKKQAEIAREFYKKLPKEKREKVLEEALTQLWIKYKGLFTKKACWIGIYLVVRDRLDEDLKMLTFCKYSITPSGWPSKLALGANSLSNKRRYIKGKDQFLEYYLMNNNPFKDLCNRFWEILLGLILTKKSAAE